MDLPLDPSLLDSLVAVVEEGSISRAARRLHLSQPAVTSRIQRLEQAAGTALLLRSVHGVSATPAGDRLVACAGEVATAVRRAVEDLGELSGAQGRARGSLEIMASTTAAAHLLPPVIARFRPRHPEVSLQLRIGNTEEVVQAVRDGDVLLGVVEGLRRASGVRLEAWLDDELVPVLGAGSRARLRQPADLASLPILWREPGSGTRAVLARALRQAGVRHRPGPDDLILGSTEAIISGAAAGLGVAFVSRWALRPHLDADRVRIVPALGLTVQRVFSWARAAGTPRGPAAVFLQFCRRHPPALT